MQRIRVALLLILILGIGIGCSIRNENQMSYNNFLTDEEVADIYRNNKEVINDIKDGLYSTFGCDVTKAVDSIAVFYDGDQLYCSEDPDGEKLQSIQNVHSDAIDYFMRVNESFNPSIMFRTAFDGIVVEFDFFDKKSGVSVGIIYTTNPEGLWGDIHIEDNWHLYRFKD